MRRTVISLALIAALAVSFGCAQKDPAAPDPVTTASAATASASIAGTAATSAAAASPAVFGKWYDSDLLEYGENCPALTLNEDGTFHLYVNLLEGMGNIQGTYTIDGDDGDIIACHVVSRDFLGFEGDDVDYFKFVSNRDTLIYEGGGICETRSGSVFRREEP